MIIAWMLCYLAIGALMFGVASGLDIVVARMGMARRWVWIGAMAAMCVLPLVLRSLRPAVQMFAYSGSSPAAAVVPRPDAVIASGAESVRQTQTVAPLFSVLNASGNRVALAPNSPFLNFENWALLAWVAAVLVCGGLLVAAQRRIARARNRWTPAPNDISRQIAALTRNHTPVWRSDDIGPAAFGVRRPEIVIPAWVLTLDDRARALLLRHEAAHVTARDPLLLRVALAAVIAMPWHLPLLFAYRRLHRAVEHDCDARVLAVSRDTRGYARLLLDTAERLTHSGQAQSWARAARWLPAPIPGIGTRRSELEDRLRAMVRPVSTWRSRVRILGAGVVSVAGVLAACSVPFPERMRSDTLQQAMVSSNGPANASAFRERSGSESHKALMSGRDSVIRLTELMHEVENLMPRGRVIQDSIVQDAARLAEPGAFRADGSADAYVWLLLDADYRTIRSTTGREFFSRRADSGDGHAVFLPAKSTTPRLELVTDKASYLRAFPNVQPDAIGLWSGSEIRVGKKIVTVNWARFVPKQLPRSGGAAAAARSVARSYPWERRATQASAERFRSWVEQMAAPYARDLLAQSPDEPPVLWLLLNTDADELAHASGRRGLFAMNPDGTFPRPPESNPATFMTPSRQLGISCNAFQGKFPEALAEARVNACGMMRTTFGGGEIIVVYGVAHPKD